MGCWENKTYPCAEPSAAKFCTDIFWLCLYVLFWCLMIIIAAFALVYGNPLRLMNGYDSFGNTCGQLNNLKLSGSSLSGISTINKPYLFYLDLLHFDKTLKICVEKCPDRLIENVYDLISFYEDTNSNLCRYDFNISALTNDTVINFGDNEHAMQLDNIFNVFGPCPNFPIYESEPVLHRCVPTSKYATEQMMGYAYSGTLNNWALTEHLLGDLYTTWHYLLGCVILALVLSLIIISILHVLTSVMSWFILILFAASCVAASLVLWSTYFKIKFNLDTIPKFQLLLENIQNEIAILVLAIMASLITIMVFIIIWNLKEKLNALLTVFKETALCLSSLPTLFGPLILACLILIGFLTFWVAVVVCLATANYPGIKPLLTINKNMMMGHTKINKSDTMFNFPYNYNTTYILVEYIKTEWLHYMWWVYLFGLIWTSEFILACLNMTIAGTVAFWYFRMPNSRQSPVLYTISKVVKYHLGSVALGSLLIVTFKIPRLILTYLYTKLKQNEASSKCASCCLKCAVCYFWALEKFIRFLNTNAYTVVVIETVDFCAASTIAWNALMSNTIQVANMNCLGNLMLFIAKIAVTAICGMVGLLLLSQRDDIHLYAIPVLVIAVFAFLIAHCVISLYETIMDTLFLCVCEDRIINGDRGRWKDSALAELVDGLPPAWSPTSGELLELNSFSK